MRFNDKESLIKHIGTVSLEELIVELLPLATEEEFEQYEKWIDEEMVRVFKLPNE
jgi:hypothetical protein